MMDTCLVAVLILSIFSYTYSLQDVKYHPNFSKLPHNECGESMSDRIIGGKESRLGQYPWLARLGYSLSNCPISQVDLSYKCGGSLITERYVVTAAHCVVITAKQICTQTGLNESLRLTHVLLGEHDSDQEIDCDVDVCADPTELFGVTHIDYHASYNNPLLKYDIALLRLKRPVIFTGWISPICLPIGEMLHKSYIGYTAEVAGWGITNVATQATSNVLLYVHAPIVDNSICQKEYLQYATITEAEVCAGGKTGEDSCGGDSGGPLMLISSHIGQPKYYLLGVVSFGAAVCGAAFTPAVYTNVPHYMKWILDHIKV